MLPGPPLILTCPHCGSKKKIDSLTSGNTFGGRVWSDSKHYYPMLPSASPVQRCPYCMGYYYLEDSNATRMEWPRNRNDIDSWDELFSTNEKCWGNGYGELSFEETDEAFTVLYPSSDDDRKSSLLFLWLFAYNDKYGGRQGKPAACPESIKNRHRMVADELCAMYPENKLLVCELLRETGRFEECITAARPLLWMINSEMPYQSSLARQIINHAKAGDTSVFELSFRK